MQNSIYGFNVTYDDLIKMIDYERFELHLNTNNLKYTFKRVKDFAKLKEYNNGIIDSIFKSPSIKNIFKNNMPIVFGTNKNKEWTIRFSSKEIIDTILFLCGMDYRTKYYELNNEVEKKEYEISVMHSIRMGLSRTRYNFDNMPKKLRDYYNKYDIEQEDMINALNDIVLNFDKIMSLKDINIEDYIKDKIEAKDMMYYIAIESLNSLNYCNRDVYGIFPYFYYKNVSEGSYVAYPHGVVVGNIAYDYTYSFFNKRVNYFLENTNLLEKGKDRYNGIYDINFELVKKGTTEKIRESFTKKLNDNPYIDERLLNQYKIKEQFFSNYDHKLELRGTNKLTGYYGYVLNNDYIVFDKILHGHKALTKQAIYGYALYRLPADKLEITNRSKSEIIKYIKNNKDSGVARLTHDKDNKYLKKLEQLQHYSNLSTKSIEDIIEEYKVKKLI